MSKDVHELLERMRSNPANVRFAEACKIVSAFFGEPRQKGTSHRVWKMPWLGDPRVNLQMSKGGKAKAYQVRQALQAIDKVRAQRTGEQKLEVRGSAKRRKKD